MDAKKRKQKLFQEIFYSLYIYLYIYIIYVNIFSIIARGSPYILQSIYLKYTAVITHFFHKVVNTMQTIFFGKI